VPHPGRGAALVALFPREPRPQTLTRPTRRDGGDRRAPCYRTGDDRSSRAHTYSDGTFSPRALVELAAQVGLSAVAVTDHDSIDGIAEALVAGGELGVEVVPGSRSTSSTPR